MYTGSTSVLAKHTWAHHVNLATCEVRPLLAYLLRVYPWCDHVSDDVGLSRRVTDPEQSDLSELQTAGGWTGSVWGKTVITRKGCCGLLLSVKN